MEASIGVVRRVWSIVLLMRRGIDGWLRFRSGRCFFMFDIFCAHSASVAGMALILGVLWFGYGINGFSMSMSTSVDVDRIHRCIEN